MLMQRLTPGTAMATVATDTVATTGPMATMVTMERDLPRLSQLPLPTQMLMLMPGTATTDTTERGLQMLSLQLSPLLLLTLTPTLMRGTDTTDTVAMDGVATTGLTATTDTMERGPLRLSQSQLLPLIPMLMLMPGTATTDTVVTTATDTDTATTAPTDTGVTGAK